MNNSPYLKSLSAQFNPRKKGESKGKLGRPSTPVLNQYPNRKEPKLSFGK